MHSKEPGVPGEVATVSGIIGAVLMVQPYYVRYAGPLDRGVSGKVFTTASSTPLMKEEASSEENVLASSMASLSTTLAGVPMARNSAIAKRKMARSIAAMRSMRQCSVCEEMILSTSSA